MQVITAHVDDCIGQLLDHMAVSAGVSRPELVASLLAAVVNDDLAAHQPLSSSADEPRTNGTNTHGVTKSCHEMPEAGSRQPDHLLAALCNDAQPGTRELRQAIRRSNLTPITSRQPGATGAHADRLRPKRFGKL